MPDELCTRGARVWILALIFIAYGVMGASGEPTLSGGLAVDKSYKGSPIPFFLKFSNGTEPLRHLRLRLLGSSDEIVFTCVAISAEVGCVAIPEELAASEILAVDGELRINKSGHHSPIAVLSFQNGSSTIPQMLFVPLGKLEVTSYAFAWLDWAKELAFPAALGFIAFVYQRQQKKTQEAKEAEKADELAAFERVEQERRQAEKRAADRIETLRLMLPRTHKYTTRHYISLQLAAEKFYESARNARETRKGPVAGDRSDELTYWFCKMYLEHRRMHLGVGGYYFTDRVGEHLLVLTFTGFDKKFFEDNTALELALSKLLDELQRVEILTFARYTECVEDSKVASQILEVRMRLTSWLASAGDELHLIGAFGCVLEFEMNRLYETWYVETEKLKIGDELRGAVIAAAFDEAATYKAYFDKHCPRASA